MNLTHPSGSPLVRRLCRRQHHGLHADASLSPKTRFDYRNYSASYIGPLLGSGKVRDITPEVVVAW
jgi:hypothetical protein